MARQTKIIATLGPAVASLDSITALIEAGVDVARLNFSHGDHDIHRQFAEWVREASAEVGRPVALLQDIQGPKLRVGTFNDGQVELETGSEVRLVAGAGLATDGTICVDYEHLCEDISVGANVLLSDGLIRAVATAVEGDSVVVEILEGGVLSDRKGVAFPSSDLQVGSLTEKDREDLEFGKELNVDYVAASFVRSGDDVTEVSRLVGRGVPIIAKVELAAAYANLDSILAVAEGVMVARGDLGVQLPLQTIPFVQADILRRTNDAGRISITATEMLESMTHSRRPTRAEVTDVANAVASGTDAVMLSAETAVGDHPVRVIEAMSTICQEVEGNADRLPVADQRVEFLESQKTFASAMAKSAAEAARNLGLDTIVAFTESGGTALLLSKYRPPAAIMAFATRPEIRQRMALYWGVTPIEFDRRDSTDRMLAAAEKYLEKAGICERGEGVVMVAGVPPNVRASTNLIKLHVIGERLTTQAQFDQNQPDRGRQGRR